MMMVVMVVVVVAVMARLVMMLLMEMVAVMVLMMMTMVLMMMNSKVREANNHFNRATAYKKKIEEEGNRVRQKYGQKFSSFVIFLRNSSNILQYNL